MEPTADERRGSRRRVLGVVVSIVLVAAIAIVLVVRYVTFEPKQFVADIQDRLSPMQPRGVDAKGGASKGARSSTDTAERVRTFESTLAALRRRYHTSSGPCYRYPTKEDLDPSGAQGDAAGQDANAAEKADEVADAILDANLTGRLEAVVPASAIWSRDADAATHAAGPEVEVVDHFASEGGLWTWLGVALHRGAVREAAKAVLDPPPPPVRGEPLSPEEEARAKPIWERYGHMRLLQGAMRLASRMHVVDLRAKQLRMLEPGMSKETVRARLGPAEEDGSRWRYPRFGTEVTFDDQGKVTGISSGLAYGDQVLVDGAEQRDLAEGALARVMGKPLRDAEGEGGETVLVYGAGPHALLLVFAGQLAKVELWRKDLVLSAR